MTKPLILSTINLLTILNPIGNAGIFLGMTKGTSYAVKRRIAWHTALAVLIVMLIGLWAGQRLLVFFGIGISAFEVAGSLVVFRIGFDMLQAKEDTSAHHTYPDQRIGAVNLRHKHDIAVVPLAIPIIAGPGTISTLIVHSSGGLHDKLLLSGITVICAFIIGLTLWFAPTIARWLGAAGMRVVTRLMGLVLTAIAAQMFINAVITVVNHFLK